MIGEFISLGMNVLIVISSIVLYVFAVSFVFPKILKPIYDRSFEGDRGIRRYAFNKGKAIVYVPSVSIKKYVDQYILSCNSGEKYIKCKIDKNVRSIKYNVITFDANDNFIDTVCVNESAILTPGITRAVLLPPKTAYVSLEINEVDGREIKHSSRFGMSLPKMGIFVLITMLCTLAEGMYINSVVLRACSLFFGSDALPAEKH